MTYDELVNLDDVELLAYLVSEGEFERIENWNDVSGWDRVEYWELFDGMEAAIDLNSDTW